MVNKMSSSKDSGAVVSFKDYLVLILLILSIIALTVLLGLSLVLQSSLQNREIYQEYVGAGHAPEAAMPQFSVDGISIVPGEMPEMIDEDTELNIGSNGSAVFSDPSESALLFTPLISARYIDGTFQFNANDGTYAFEGSGSGIRTSGSYVYLEGSDAVSALNEDGINTEILRHIAWNTFLGGLDRGERFAVGYLTVIPHEAESDELPAKPEFQNEVGAATHFIFFMDKRGHIAIYSPLWNAYGTYASVA